MPFGGHPGPHTRLDEHERRQRDQVDFSEFFTAERPRDRVVLAAGAAQRPDADVHQCRHGAVQERLHRRREAALPARHHLAEMRARRRQAQRPRQCRLHRAPSHLLRDARQFLVRRLLQGARDRAGLEPDHQGIRAARRTSCSSPSTTPTTRRPGSGRRSRASPTTASSASPTSDNFWAMGDTGPCGPCSEIFIDRGDTSGAARRAARKQDGDRFLEFWNLVFMQFEQVTKEERVRSAASLDRHRHGAGAHGRILQGVDSVFETDLFRASDRRDRRPALGAGPQGEQTVASFRVIADHLRSSAFLIADGVLPSNEGRGYVLRRIMRRAMRHAQLLGAEEPLMHRLVWALVREMGQAYPELVRAENLIEETLRLEETRFRKTLVRGLPSSTRRARRLKKGDMFDGDTAFTLYDTYGFPLDLTQDALKSRGISVDQASFTDAMERQRAKARASWAGSGEAASESDLVPAAREARRDRISGLRDRERRRRGRRAGEGRQGDRQPQGRRDRRDRAEPDAVLCGVRRPGRRHRRADRRGRRQVPRHRHAEEGRRSLRASSARWSRAR